jgi:hypothetical protein
VDHIRFIFPALAHKFPVLSQKFPVLRSREFHCKSLDLLVSRPSNSLRNAKFCKIPVNFPVSREFGWRDRFEIDCVRHHAVLRISDPRDLARKARVGAAYSTRGFSCPVSGRRNMPNLGPGLWPKKTCSWRYDALRKGPRASARASHIAATIPLAHRAGLQCRPYGAGAPRPRPAPGSAPGTPARSSY